MQKLDRLKIYATMVIMRRDFLKIAAMALISTTSLNAFAFDVDTSTVPNKVSVNKEVKEIKGSLFVTEQETAQIIINKQQEKDVEDLEMIWMATVNKNPIIKFTLEKLAIPEEQRRIHSSLMAKSMSAIISGASILPSFLGMNYGIQSASYATARLANNLINKKNTDILQNSPLTDTEAIELASLIEDLQDEIVIAYYCYKNSLIRLKNLREQMLLKNKNYNDAIKHNDNLEITVNSAAWQNKLIEEYELKQEAKRYYLMLQRLAGTETIDKLNLVVYELKTQGVEQSDLNFEKREFKAEFVNEKKKGNKK